MRRQVFWVLLLVTGSQLSAQSTNDISNGLIAYWSFDDGSASDSSGNGFHGTIVGNLEPIVGVKGQGLHFPGGSFISVEGNELGITDSIERSISLWARPESLPGDGCGLISKYRHFDVPQSNFYARLSALGSEVMTRLTGEGTDVIDIVAGRLNVWQHYVFVMKAGQGNSKIYRNGVLVATGDLSYNPSFSSEPLRIGTVVGAGDQTFIGDLDEIRIYDRVLTDDEIRALSGCSLPTSQPITFHRPVGPPTNQRYTWYSCGGSAMLTVANESAPPSYIYLNGVAVAVPGNFSFNRPIRVPVNLLSGENILDVRLLGKPEGQLSVEFLP